MKNTFKLNRTEMSVYVLSTKRPSQDDVIEMMPQEPCPLDDTDVFCGQIFYSSQTTYLKFQCDLCGDVFLNIASFCDHLNKHINESAQNVTESSDEMFVKAESGDEVLEPESFATSESIKMEDDEDLSEVVVEEIDETAEILAEIKEEMRVYDQEDFTMERDDSGDFTDGDEEVLPQQFTALEDAMITKSGKLSFQDCFEKASVSQEISSDSVTNQLITSPLPLDILPPPQIPSPSPALKKKRVTTVKIIASKNKIAELYKLIELKEKNQTEQLQTDPATPAEEFQPHGGKDHQQIVRKLVGETLITHIPKGSTSQSTADSYNCPACGGIFNSSYSLSIHKRTHYLDTDNRIKLAHKCSECNKLFNKISEMKDHIIEFHYPDGFQCKICSKKLTSLTLLEGHIERVHLNRPFNCKVCKKNFDDRELYDAHVASHVGAKIFKCHICGRKYSAEKMLKLHLERHKAQIPQCCVVCGKMTLRIVQHMKIHTPRPKRVLTCSACGKVFNHSSGLSQHIRMWHKNPQSPARKRRIMTRNSTNAESQKDVQPEGLKDVIQREEEAKRVIVEMIQSADYSCYDIDDGQDVIPPMAREETISAVNSIVSD